MRSYGRGHYLGIGRQGVPVGLHVFEPIAPHKGDERVIAHLRHVKRGWVLVAIHDGNARVRTDAPTLAPLLDVPHVVGPEAPAAEDDEVLHSTIIPGVGGWGLG